MVVWVTMRLSNHLYILPYIWTNNWMIIRSAALSFLCADTRLKIRVSSLNRYLFCDSRSCPNNQSCRNIQQGKTLRFRCPLQSAPVRTDGFFLPRNGCNIAPGTDPAMETVTEDFQNFSQRFSGADFCCRQTTASCTFVCRKVFRHTKGARSARLGGVPESRHLNYQTDDNHEKEDRTPDNDRSQSPQV